MPMRPSFHRAFHVDRGAAGIGHALDEELAFHLDMTVRELMAGGMGEDDARREARRRFGDLQRTRAAMAAIDRERVGRRSRVDWWQAVVHDLRYALRGLRLKPGFAAAVVLTLALGIGANATMFGIVDRLLLRAPAYMIAPDRVNRVFIARTSQGKEFTGNYFQYRRYLDLRQWTHSFDVTAAVTRRTAAIGQGIDAKEHDVAAISASTWKLFDARPVLGRFFSEDEDRPPYGTPVAVLSYAFWQSDFAGSRGVLGKRVQIGPTTFTIIGVAPRGFAATELQTPAAFIPITVAGAESGRNEAGVPTYHTGYNMSWLQMLVRRKPGVSLEQATADLTNAEHRSYLAEAAGNPGLPPIGIARPHVIAAPIQPERGPNESEAAKVATWLVGVALVVLLIACANVGNLLLGRALKRRREIAVRIALGITRGRLLAQLLTESVLLAVLGGAAGILLAHWGGNLLRVTLVPNVEWSSTIADARVLYFAGACALAAGILTGVAPVLQARRTDVAISLKSGAREGTVHRSRLRITLLVAQAALSVVLLVGAGLFVRSLRAVQHLDLGFDAEHLVHVDVNLRGMKLTHDETANMWESLVRRAAQLPSVASASRAATVPFRMTWSEDLHVPGLDSVTRLGEFDLQLGSGNYFATAGTRILRGRGFDPTDGSNAAKVAVVSESMARTLWPHADALGKCIRLGADTAPCRTVVGVAEDIKTQDLRNDPGLMYYMPVVQFRPWAGGLYVRMRGDASKTESVQRELQRMLPGSAYISITRMSDVIDDITRAWRLGAMMFTIFGLLALALASVGLYSVIAYDVTQRTHEMGVRVALGAQARDVVGLVVREGVGIALAGIAIGTGAAVIGSRFMAPLLFRVSPRDPAVFIGVIVTLLAVATLASLLPAWRAARVDPNVALRAD